MKLENLYKPNTIIEIAIDINEKKVYAVDTTTRKFYVHPHDFGISVNTGVMTGLVLSIILSRIAEQFRPQFYISGISHSFKMLLIGIGILIGFSIFCLRLALEKKHTLHLGEYLKKHPLAEEVSDINRVIEKAAFITISSLVFIIGGAVGSVLSFNRFLDDSNLLTYFWAVLWLVFFHFQLQ